MRDYLDFEKPLKEIEEKIEKLTGTGAKASNQEEVRKLRAKLAQTEHELYEKLTPWQRTRREASPAPLYARVRLSILPGIRRTARRSPVRR